MPDYFSHNMAADAIYEKLPESYRERITDHDLYLLGSQGGDLYFFYNGFITFLFASNVGRGLHARKPAELFDAFIQGKGDPSYIAGFATHYAMDSILHPYVYMCQDERHKRFPFHMKFENDLGLFISKDLGLTRDRMPKDVILSKAPKIYENLALVDDRASLKGTEKCLKDFDKYVDHFYKVCKDTYRVKSYDFDSLHEPLQQAIQKGVLCVEQVLDGDIDPALFETGFSEHTIRTPETSESRAEE
ncbi:MAG: hypothetical protein LUE27_06255 [Clostridia bacterium]|nr:hypothetical protein [Clostridia bacterium]